MVVNEMGGHIMVTAEERIQQLKNRVREKERGSVIVDRDGGLWDPEEAMEKNIIGKTTKSIVHGHGDCNAMV